MLLAQAAEAAKIAGKALDESAQYGFPAYFLMVFFIAVLGALGLHFWFIVRPDSKNRIECSTKLADAVQAFAVNDAAKTQILDQIADWHRAHDSRLSAMKCPMQSQAPVSPISPVPHPV